jgi:NitT/TauT family transport system substrate-binding protein
MAIRSPQRAGAELTLETKSIRLLRSASLCWAPQYVAEDLLRAEGFTEVTYGPFSEASVSEYLTDGKADISLNFVGPNIVRVDQGDAVVFLAGIHVGCFEVFGTARVPRIRDLKGKTVGVAALYGAEYVFLASIAAHVGLDPRRDITWVVNPPNKSIELFKEGKIDVILGFPPTPQRLREERIGRVLVNSATDRPWSQYFCCLVTASREFVRRNPVATKAAVRAMLKATDMCAQDPESAARRLVAGGYTQNYDHALQVLKELPYGRWHDYDPEDTVRFYALRLHEVGLIKGSPQKIIAQAGDWRIFNELKTELKG